MPLSARPGTDGALFICWMARLPCQHATPGPRDGPACAALSPAPPGAQEASCRSRSLGAPPVVATFCSCGPALTHPYVHISHDLGCCALLLRACRWHLVHMRAVRTHMHIGCVCARASCACVVHACMHACTQRYLHTPAHANAWAWVSRGAMCLWLLLGYSVVAVNPSDHPLRWFEAEQ